MDTYLIKKIFLIQILCFFLIHMMLHNLLAQEYKKIQWETELCSCQALSNLENLNSNTIHILYQGLGAFSASEKIDWWDYRNVSNKELVNETRRYKAEVKQKLNDLSQIAFPAIPIIKKYKENVVQNIELSEYLYLSILDFLKTNSTNPLKSNFGKEKLPAKCIYWANIIASKDEVYRVLPEFIKKQCSNNANPQRCENDTIRKTRNDFKNAQLELLVFGWHRCVNHHYRTNNVFDHTNIVFDELEKYMKNKSCECDEP